MAGKHPGPPLGVRRAGGGRGSAPPGRQAPRGERRDPWSRRDQGGPWWVNRPPRAPPTGPSSEPPACRARYRRDEGAGAARTGPPSEREGGGAMAATGAAGGLLRPRSRPYDGRAPGRPESAPPSGGTTAPRAASPRTPGGAPPGPAPPQPRTDPGAADAQRAPGLPTAARSETSAEAAGGKRHHPPPLATYRKRRGRGALVQAPAHAAPCVTARASTVTERNERTCARSSEGDGGRGRRCRPRP